MSRATWQTLAVIENCLTSNMVDTEDVKSHKIRVNLSESSKQKALRSKTGVSMREAYELVSASVEFKPFETNFSRDVGFTSFGVFAKEFIPQKTLIEGLVGFLAPISTADIKKGENDFSIFASKKGSMMMLGPASFINSSCKPNCMYVPSMKESILRIQVTAPTGVKKGEEVTVCYSGSFFGNAREDCGCPYTEYHGDRIRIYESRTRSGVKSAKGHSSPPIASQVRERSPAQTSMTPLPAVDSPNSSGKPGPSHCLDTSNVSSHSPSTLTAAQLVPANSELSLQPSKVTTNEKNDYISLKTQKYLPRKRSTRRLKYRRKRIFSTSSSSSECSSRRSNKLELNTEEDCTRTAGTENSSHESVRCASVEDETLCNQRESLSQLSDSLVTSDATDSSVGMPLVGTPLGASTPLHDCWASEGELSIPTSCTESQDSFSNDSENDPPICVGSSLTVSQFLDRFTETVSIHGASDRLQRSLIGLISDCLPHNHNLPSVHRVFKSQTQEFERTVKTDVDNGVIVYLNIKKQLYHLIQKHVNLFFNSDCWNFQKDIKLPETSDQFVIYLIISTDGVQPIKSSSFELYPVWLQIANLPGSKRSAFGNMILAALFSGSGKPPWYPLLAEAKRELTHMSKGCSITLRNRDFHVSRFLPFRKHYL